MQLAAEVLLNNHPPSGRNALSAYHEGLGYQDYTCSYLVPAALLREARTGTDLTQNFPGLVRPQKVALVRAKRLPGKPFHQPLATRTLMSRGTR